MLKIIKALTTILVLGSAAHIRGEVSEKVVDIATLPHVTQRMLVHSPEKPSPKE